MNQYKKSGVNIDKGEDFVTYIKEKTKSQNIGGFSGLFPLDLKKFKEPLIVSSTDGVGTKLKIAFLTGKHDTVGIDLVAMCANDIICSGATPLFFLDYFATGKLDLEIAKNVINGIISGCEQANMALSGGETAEMPDFYKDNEFDLAGFCVGAVNKKNVIDGKNIKEGDVLIGLESSGLHSNGYSLVRKILFKDNNFKIADRVDELNGKLGEVLIKPTKIYVKSILEIINKFKIKGIVHITGGGFHENIPRILPAKIGVKINKSSWPIKPIFNFLQKTGNISEQEMYRVFNMGIGMVLVCEINDKNMILQLANSLNEKAHVIGEVCKCKGKQVEVL